jgi:uncharacterized membrane protein YsdA (DUF1294 family)
MAATKCAAPKFWKISEEDMTSTHQISGAAGACSGMMDVFYA